MNTENTPEQLASQLYEREIQEFLGGNLHLLGTPSLKLVQLEYPIKFGRDAGRIDILAKDVAGAFVAMEIKRGQAGRGAVGQLQSYMGSLLSEYPGATVRGVLVAMSLDEAAKAALLVTTDIEFFEFKTRFDFHRVQVFRPLTRIATPLAAQIAAAEFRTGYWEPMGGTVTNVTAQCKNCGKLTRIVHMGANSVCGVCGHSAH